MKTREHLYGKEAANILRDITTYHCVHREQIRRIHSEQGDRIDFFLNHLLRQGRIFHPPAKEDIFLDEQEGTIDLEMLSAIWVLCDFAERAEYHAIGEYPVKLLFFADGEVYDVIYVPIGKEALITCALGEKTEDGKRLVIVESIDQTEKMEIPGVAAYCLVDRTSGEVRYYTLED